MCQKYAKHFFSIIFLFTVYSATAQNSNKENIPYTRYGIGDILTGTNVQLRGMGYLTSAYASTVTVNTENPASYASLRLTTYEVGGQASSTTIYSGGKSFGTGNATLAYLNVGIPVGKHAGVAFGLKPVSKVYYKMQYDKTVDTPFLGKTSYIYSGDGGLNYAYLGGAYDYKGFSLGFNFGYKFGTIRNSSVLQSSDTFNVMSSEFTRYTKIGGLSWNLGAMYVAKLNTKMKLRIGATFNLGEQLNATKDDYMVDFRMLNGTLDQDTAYHSAAVKGKIKLPTCFSIGAQLIGNDKWTAGVDFSSTQWSQYRNFEITDSVANSMKIGVGGEFTPNANNMFNYLQRVSYRLGFYYGTDYVKLENTAINYYAITLGASLPFKRSPDRIHTALEIGQRGTESKGLIRESFVKFSLGISLNDKWFIPRKYE